MENPWKMVYGSQIGMKWCVLFVLFVAKIDERKLYAIGLNFFKSFVAIIDERQRYAIGLKLLQTGINLSNFLTLDLALELRSHLHWFYLC